MKTTKIQDQVALVTGANRGIGKAITEALLERGAAKVYATARSLESLAPLQEKWGERVVALPLDVTDHQQVRATASDAGDTQLLFNNAGVALFGEFTRPDAREAARTEMDVNYFGTLNTTQEFAPVLQRNGGGAIVNIASMAALVNFPMLATYSASKAALHSLTQASRLTLSAQGTQVVGVYPGPVDTEMSAELAWDKASPAEVANAVLDGLEKGDDYVYPDVMAAGMGEQYEKDPRSLEQVVAQMGEE